jgi:hypothetical protein
MPVKQLDVAVSVNFMVAQEEVDDQELAGGEYILVQRGLLTCANVAAPACSGIRRLDRAVEIAVAPNVLIGDDMPAYIGDFGLPNLLLAVAEILALCLPLTTCSTSEHVWRRQDTARVIGGMCGESSRSWNWPCCR